LDNKYVKYSLIIAALAIWVTIIYKIVAGLSGPADPVISERLIPKKEIKRNTDSFNLYVDYPDPFLGSAESTVIDTVAKKPPSVALDASTTPVKPMTAEMIAGMIQYNGMISNPKKKSKIAIVTIRGREYLVREKEKAEDFQIRKIEKDRLSIGYKGEFFTIHK
jgi:hypothetical protein